MGQIHKDPSYIWQTDDVEWTIRRPFLIVTPYGMVLVWDSFKFDKDSIVRNSPDWVPSCCHDLLCRHGVWADGLSCSRWTADRVYYWLNRHSVEEYNRNVARRNYIGVTIGTVWYKLKGDKVKPVSCRGRYLIEYYRRHGQLPPEKT